MSELYSSGEPSDCIFSDACRFIVDLRNSADNPFEHLDEVSFDLLSAEVVACSVLIRENPDLINSLEHSEMTELTRALFSLIENAKEAKRYD